jgi:O-antigen polysaccharide polymerase Wzy
VPRRRFSSATADSSAVRARLPAGAKDRQTAVVRSKALQAQRFRLFAPPALITAILWVTSLTPVSIVQALIGYALLCIPWWAYTAWKREGTSRVPFFALISMIVWTYFALPLFWGDRSRPGILGGTLPDDAVTQTMFMALLSVGILWLGMKVKVGRHFALPHVRDIPADPSRWTYLRFLMVIASVFSLIPNAAYIGGESGRQIILAMQTSIPLIIFVFLFRNYLRGTTSPIDRYILLLFVASQLVLGLAGGWLGSFLAVMLAALAMYLAERKKIPIVPVVLVLAYAVFFQAGKSTFRDVYWYGSTQSSSTQTSGILQRVQSWAQLSLTNWQSVLSNPSTTMGPALFQGVVQRVNLLNQTAHVVEFTPSPVPYQDGATYTPILLNLVPRLVWPDKPSVNQPNQFYQVAYGLTAPSNLSHVSIASGVIAEGYMNLGWLGVLVVMFLLGILFGWFEATFLAAGSGALYSSLGIVLAVHFLTLEEQMNQYLGGTVQTIILAFLVFLPATYLADRKDGRSQEGGDGRNAVRRSVRTRLSVER